jgi:hypothetical protein
MFVVYKRPTRAEVDETIQPTVQKVTEFFAANPKRKSCKVGMWYDKVVTFKRGDDFEKVMKEYAATVETVETPKD